MNKAKEDYEKETGLCAIVMVCKGQHSGPVPVRPVATDGYLKWLEFCTPATDDELRQLRREMDWLDDHCSFVADHPYRLGPFKRGELRKLAQAGIAADQDVYYCQGCALKYSLGLGGQPKAPEEELAAGYCMICGVASPYVGHVKRNDPKLPKEIAYDKVDKSR